MNRREFSQQLYGAALNAAFFKMTVAQQQTHDTGGQQSRKPTEIIPYGYTGAWVSRFSKLD
jgi:hypothetical protein